MYSRLRKTSLFITLLACVISYSHAMYNYSMCLHEAACKGNLEAVKREIEENKVDVDFVYPPNHSSRLDYGSATALLTASYQGHLDVVKYLIKKGATIDKGDEFNRTPLLGAIDGDKIKIINYLLDNNADINKYCDYKAFTDDFRHKIISDGAAPLHRAVKKGSVTIVKTLISRKNIIIDQENYLGETPLTIAIVYEKTEIVKILLEAGANPNKKNDKSSQICYESFPQQDRFFLPSAEKPHSCAKKSAFFVPWKSPIHAAAKKGNIEILKMLVRYKGNPLLLTNDETPIDCMDKKTKKEFLQWYNELRKE